MSRRCVKSNLLKCPGILQSELDYSELHVITIHLMTCTKDTGKINVTKCQRFEVDHNTKALIPAEEFVKRRLRRQKSKNNPITPNCLSEVVIENDWCFCYLGDKSTQFFFLLHDNGTTKLDG
ncbi:Uncharacterized protein FWK35_00031949 [Aphis craccivora]|uniref:Uncharacterized protein n=1 Tax=Aphis craccivora TaxID=307492 RepID=A0A6G0YV21_APHCR|nr:Uncharacterized protein FWK35_00031949 [Aphis craccivora]